MMRRRKKKKTFRSFSNRSFELYAFKTSDIFKEHYLRFYLPSEVIAVCLTTDKSYSTTWYYSTLWKTGMTATCDSSLCAYCFSVENTHSSAGSKVLESSPLISPKPIWCHSGNDQYQIPLDFSHTVLLSLKCFKIVDVGIEFLFLGYGWK